MSYPYGMPGSDRSGRRRRTPVVVVAAAVAVLAVAALVVLSQRPGPEAIPAAGPPAATPPTTAPPTTIPPATAADLSWSQVAGQPVPVSAAHGPARQSKGRASGFTHDELGAALAALHIQARLTVEAGPQVYESTALEQCFGDVDNTIAAIRGSRSTATAESATPSVYYYKIISGDPAGLRVLVSVAGQTLQASANGGYGAVLRVLEWRDGDWKMELPAPRPQIIPSVDSYISLGGPT